jgi:hypothetical protein
MPDESAKEGELVRDEESPLECPPHSFDLTIQAESRAEAVMTDDVKAINHSLQQLGKAWRTATTIDDVCKLAMSTTKLLTERRRLMLLSLDPDESRTKKKKPYLEPPPRELESDPRYS